MSVPTNALTYNGYINQIGTMAVVDTFTPTTNTTINGITYLANVAYGGTLSQPDTNFNNLIPQMLNYAELRIQRDLDLSQSVTSNSNYTLSVGNNTLSISVNDFVTLQTVGIVSGTATLPLIPTSKEYIQNVYNDSSYFPLRVFLQFMVETLHLVEIRHKILLSDRTPIHRILFY